MKRTIFLIIILFLSNLAQGALRRTYEDATIVERSELIVVAHIKEGSIEYIPHKKDQWKGASWEHHVILVVKDVLKGQCDEKEIPITIHYGLTPVVGGYIKRDNFMLNRRGGRNDYPKDIIEIFDTGNSAQPQPSRVKDAREDNLWFLCKRGGQYGRELGTGSYGIADPEDLQPIEWKDYFLAYMSDDPETAVKEWAKNNPDRADRAQRYFDHLKVQRILRIEDPQGRLEKLLPYFLKHTIWNMDYEAKAGIISCGKIAGEHLMKSFDEPEYKSMRPRIILMWRDMEYRESIPFLIELLSKHEQFWAEQKLEKGWWNNNVRSALTRRRRGIYSEVYYAVATLRRFKAVEAKEILEATKNRWEAVNFDNTQIVEECEAALREITK